jgi:hypothetical protein
MFLRNMSNDSRSPRLKSTRIYFKTNLLSLYKKKFHKQNLILYYFVSLDRC